MQHDDPQAAEDQREEFRKLGLVCLTPTVVRFRDGTTATVKAEVYLSSPELRRDTPEQQRALKFYAVCRDGAAALELIDEIELWTFPLKCFRRQSNPRLSTGSASRLPATFRVRHASLSTHWSIG